MIDIGHPDTDLQREDTVDIVLLKDIADTAAVVGTEIEKEGKCKLADEHIQCKTQNLYLDTVMIRQTAIAAVSTRRKRRNTRVDTAATMRSNRELRLASHH